MRGDEIHQVGLAKTIELGIAINRDGNVLNQSEVIADFSCASIANKTAVVVLSAIVEGRSGVNLGLSPGQGSLALPVGYTGVEVTCASFVGIRAISVSSAFLE